MRSQLALALCAAFGACGAPPPIESAPPPPVLGGSRIVARVENGELSVYPRDPRTGGASAPQTAPVRLDSLWLDTGRGPEEIGIVGWAADPDGKLVARAEHGDHGIQLSVRLAGPDSLRLELVDEIVLPADVRELRVVWSVATPTVDELEGPSAAADGLARDDWFRSPWTYVRSGTRAAGLSPDLVLLNEDRRLPQRLGLELATERRPGETLLVHGLIADDPIELRGERLRLAHQLVVRDDAEPFVTRAALHDRLFAQLAAPLLERSAYPLEDQSWDQLQSSALTTSGLPRGEGVQILRFGERRNLLHDALALALVGARRGDAELTARADEVAGFVLSAPRRAGLLPGACAYDPVSGDRAWSPGDPDGVAPDAYRAVDAATSARLLLQLAELLPDRRAAVEELCSDLARLFAQSQGSDGRIPALFESRYLAPVELAPARDLRAETGGPAWFLAAWSRHADDRGAQAAARRALAFLATGPMNDGAWPDLPGPDGLGGPVPVRDTIAMARALRAAATLAAGDPADPAAAMVAALAASLVAHQSVWQPVWHREPRLGAFAPSNVPGAEGDAATPLAAEALLAAHVLSGDRTTLQRAALALRRSLLDADAPEGTRRALAVAVTERVRRTFGQAVVSAEGAWAEGLDAVWFEQLAVEGNRIGFRLLTEAPELQQVRVRFRELPEPTAGFVVGRSQSEPRPRAALLAGVDLPTRRVPSITFRPPQHLRAGSTWTPEARIRGELSDRASASLVLEASATPGTGGVRIPLRRDDGQLVAEEPFDTTGLAPGSVLRAWIEIDEGDWRGRTPELGPGREIEIGAMDVIDVGDEAETQLVDGGERSEIVRFVDGRENARLVEPGERLLYRLEVRPDALGVEMRLRHAGPIRVALAEGDEDAIVLHEDGDTARATPFVELPLAVSDPRRWRDGLVDLWIEPAGNEPVQVARIAWLATGNAAALPGDTERERRPPRPHPRIGVCVVPVVLAGQPEKPSREALEQAFFGGPDYRSTPPPEPRLTIGSAARWIDQLSGGLTSLVGRVVMPEPSEVTVAELRDGGDAVVERLLTDIEQAVGAGLSDLAATRRVVVVVLGGRPLEAPLMSNVRIDGRPDRAGGVPVIVLSERSATGSFLSCGRIVLSLLHAIYVDIVDLGSPPNGNFGELALSAEGAGPLPEPPAGVNLERAGWASRLEVGRVEGEARWINMTPMAEGHVIYELDDDTLDDRGRLLLELRAPTDLASTIDPDEGRTRHGLLIYRELPAAHALLVRRRDGSTVTPRYWRVSAGVPPLATPFVPGTFEDLFRGERRIPDAWLSTPQGETPWTVDDVRLIDAARMPDDSPTPPLRVTWHGTDLLAEDRGGWAVGDSASGFAPVPLAESDGPIHRAETGGHAFELPAGTGRALRLNTVLPPRNRPMRLFGRLEELTGSGGRLRVAVAGRIVIDTTLEPDLRRQDKFVVDLPLTRDPTPIVVELRAAAGELRGRLARLVAVPCSANATRVPLPDVQLRQDRLGDGVLRGDVGRLRLDQRGTARLRLPVLLPAGAAGLRLHVGTPSDAIDDLEVEATVRSLNGADSFVALDPTTVGPGRPMLLALCELPTRSQREPALLDIVVEGPPQAELSIVDVAVEQW